MTKLTLPPQVGRRYLYRNKEDDSGQLYECEIVRKEKFDDYTVWNTEDERGDHWTYWPDGKAKVRDYKDPEQYVAQLVEDVEEDETETLLRQRDDMMKRLKEMGAC